MGLATFKGRHAGYYFVDKLSIVKEEMCQSVPGGSPSAS
ncbi:hypothetical protein BIW11_03542 [Tropilaelaps mercedesae]|uniref:Uncharacterized protein n=1 Tax=Tropilaelaps mercedesae TaxID=418985 RepID=A0A1V9XJC5_9ACAR|nr:hypothetical protein BIW11_03542 [Tropilaelaps mercedesae]